VTERRSETADPNPSVAPSLRPSVSGARAILLDIEGTTSSISFVYDVMFPYVKRELDSFLIARWHDPALKAALDQLAHEVDEHLENFSSAEEWFTAEVSPLLGPSRVALFEEKREIVGNTVNNMMLMDRKNTGLKQLQGLIWQSGFESGELKAHVYDDVPPALVGWNSAGKDVRIYSSGSVQAQKLFFGHTIAGNLLPQFRGHYDTTMGPKKEAESYRKIAADFKLPPDEILFLSDVVAELDAARGAGMQTALVVRPNNPSAPAGHSHRVIETFAGL
jgi:enolase-phosphatase E1